MTFNCQAESKSAKLCVDLYRVSKKMHLKEMVVIETKNRHLFDPLVKNCPFSVENSLKPSKNLISHVK